MSADMVIITLIKQRDDAFKIILNWELAYTTKTNATQVLHRISIALFNISHVRGYPECSEMTIQKEHYTLNNIEKKKYENARLLFEKNFAFKELVDAKINNKQMQI